MLVQGMTKTVRILLFVNIWTTFLDTNITEKVMDEVETMDWNQLGYTFHSQALVIPVKGRNLVHIIQSYTINEAPKVTKVHWRYDHDKLLEIAKNMKSDYCFSILDPSIAKTIRRYRLNKWGHRGGKRHKLLWRQMGINANMLVPVPITKKILLKR